MNIAAHNYLRWRNAGGHHGLRELRAGVLAALETDNYDTLTVAEVTERLNDLSDDELKQLRELEKRTKDRESLLERIDRKIRANF